MAERLTPRAREIVAAARALLEESGAAALTMRTLADRLGIKAPSLYKHFPDKHAVEVELTGQMLAESAEALEAAEARTPGSLEALAEAYRTYALAHPHLYCLATEQPLPRAELPAGLEDRAALPLLRACAGRPGPGPRHLGLRPRHGDPGDPRPVSGRRGPGRGMETGPEGVARLAGRA